jgi:hypothetical protein
MAASSSTGAATYNRVAAPGPIGLGELLPST